MPQRCQRRPVLDEHMRRESEPIGGQPGACAQQFGRPALDHRPGRVTQGSAGTFHPQGNGPHSNLAIASAEEGSFAQHVEPRGRGVAPRHACDRVMGGHGFPPARSAPRTAHLRSSDQSGHAGRRPRRRPGIGEAAASTAPNITASQPGDPGQRCQMHTPIKGGNAWGTGPAHAGLAGSRGWGEIS